MIERFFLKGNFIFDELELVFDKSLIVFSGASGSGKSVLIDSILSVFSLKNIDSELSEISLSSDNDLIVFKRKKVSSKNRYFINNETINKKELYEKACDFIHFLSLKDNSDFSNDSLITLLDLSITSKDNKFNDIKTKYYTLYNEWEIMKNELKEIEKKEKELIEKKEFILFEIEKIENCNPKEHEYDELISIKKSLSHKEKIESAIIKANNIFDYESEVHMALSSIGVDSSFFDDTIEELRGIFDEQNDKLKELEETDIEEILDRLQLISGLITKYGSIKEAIEYKNIKIKELDKYENISFDKKILSKQIDKNQKVLITLAKDISKKRLKGLKKFTEDINSQNMALHLEKISIEINSDKDLYKYGIDEIIMSLDKTILSKISSGETNRLRLSLLAIKNLYSKFRGIIILDEIDANLSGIESEAVAKVLFNLSKNYQIICISHHPQLASYATQHFLVSKSNNKSSVALMNKKQRVNEIARMISGENVSEKSINFSKELLARK